MDIILLFGIGSQTEARLLLPGRGKNTPSKGHVSRPGHKVRALRILFGLWRGGGRVEKDIKLRGVRVCVVNFEFRQVFPAFFVEFCFFFFVSKGAVDDGIVVAFLMGRD